MLRAIAAIFIALASLFSFCFNTAENPVTGENQRVGLTHQQERELGQRALPELVSQHGGLLPNQSAQAEISEIGQDLVSAVPFDLPYVFEFRILADRKTLNAFALPGGEVCITYALLSELESTDQLAAILAHEISHVIARHSAEQMAKRRLAEGLTGATVVATYDPHDARSRAQMAMVLSQLVDMNFSREDELEADRMGVRILAAAGYDPQAMLEVMTILENSRGAGGPPEFLSTHPSPDDRRQRIQEAIDGLESSDSWAVTK